MSMKKHKKAVKEDPYREFHLCCWSKKTFVIYHRFLGLSVHDSMKLWAAMMNDIDQVEMATALYWAQAGEAKDEKKRKAPRKDK